ncbi:hypothetical protein THRCLA_00127 [Thraustotheca clavata]|uniref:HSF-type DNA-binding domain-containing protein n=1 Tax=Thraustotheca clavata TaxID=74557 RepID=A0A1W0AC65_9STRA|nr:hypothetical protein THRCLA_00127 [Thraustotheca clavata]
MQITMSSARKNRPNVFIEKLVKMVEFAPDRVIGWSKDGSKIIVQGVTPLENDYLPRFYHHRSFLNFTRQLRVYGFSKSKLYGLPCDETMNAKRGFGYIFAHPFVHRDHTEQLCRVQRMTMDDSHISELRAAVEGLKSDKPSPICYHRKNQIMSFIPEQIVSNSSKNHLKLDEIDVAILDLLLTNTKCL